MGTFSVFVSMPENLHEEAATRLRGIDWDKNLISDITHVKKFDGEYGGNRSLTIWIVETHTSKVGEVKKLLEGMGFDFIMAR